MANIKSDFLLLFFPPSIFEPINFNFSPPIVFPYRHLLCAVANLIKWLLLEIMFQLFFIFLTRLTLQPKVHPAQKL